MATRRKLLTFAALGSATLAGCAGDGGSEGSGGVGESNEESCRMVTRTHEETIGDEMETISAGGTWTWHADLEEGDRLILSARLVGDGARPALAVENPSGASIAEIGPSERIQREIRAREEGRYYIIFENEATLTRGQWDVTIDFETDYEEEVCN